MTGGPIFMLRLGLLLPCCENSENKSARQSVAQFNTLGSNVDWHQGMSSSRKSAVAAAGFVKSLFSSSSSKSQQQQHTDDKPPTRSQIRIVDATKDSINNGLPYPELQIKPLPKAEGDDNIDDNNDGNNTKKGGLGGLLKKQNQNYQLDIPLHHIQRIDSIDPTMIVIITMDVHSTDENATTKEAARISFPSSDDRDAASLDLKVLVEWNKNRQPDIEEDLPAAGIRARAKKAAHFAKRELEMRETKRSREQRKAKYMEGSVGLKYTAMAMANRATES